MPISLSILIVKINIFQSIGIEYSAPDVPLIHQGVPLYLATLKNKIAMAFSTEQVAPNCGFGDSLTRNIYFIAGDRFFPYSEISLSISRKASQRISSYKSQSLLQR